MGQSAYAVRDEMVHDRVHDRHMIIVIIVSQSGIHLRYVSL